MTLLEIRNQIDKIDDELLNLILKRIECSELLAQIKYENNKPITDEIRENSILMDIKEKSADKHKYVVPIFQTIIDTSKSLQNELITNYNK